MPPKPAQQHRQAVGLLLHPNRFALPPGALLEADNVVIDRPGVVSKSRGFERYGTELDAPALAMGEFDNSIVLLDGQTLKYDSDAAGTWAAMAGTFDPPDADHRMRFLESRQALYFTSSTGIHRVDQLGNDPKPAGMPQGLDIELELSGTGLGWMMGNTQVAYKVVWLRKDANGQELPGTASFREIITNSKTEVTWTFAAGVVTVTHTAHGYATGDTVQITEADAGNEAVELPTSIITVTGVDTYTYTIAGTPGASGTAKAHRLAEVTLTTTIPAGVEAGDFYEVYRTEQSADDTTDPGDRHLLVKRIDVTAADITAGTVTFVDDFDEVFLGLELYSNATAEGLAQTNDRPPFARDLAVFRGHTFYANTRQPHFIELQFLETTGLANGNTITIGGRTYTFAAAENIGTQSFRLEQTLTTEAENVEATMKSLTRVVNRDAGNTTFYMYYTSGALEPPGKMLIRRRDLTDTALALTANSAATGDNFSPTLPASGTTVSTDNDAAPNRLYRSKFEQPDAVPLTSFDSIGAERDAILRIIALLNSLIIYTERSILRLSGEDEQSFTIDVLESAVRLLAPESCAVLNDSVHSFTSQGVGAVNENGLRIESFLGIEVDLQKIQNFPGYKTLTWGIGYEQDRKYLLFTQGEAGDTTAVHGWQFNYLTNSWTRRLKTAVAGVVLKESDRLYLAHSIDAFILRERKSFNTSNADFRDEDIPATIDAVGTTLDEDGNTVTELTLTFAYTTVPLAEKWLVSQGFSIGRIVSVVDNGASSFTVVLETFEDEFVVGAATLGIPIPSRVRWAPEVGDNPAVTKMYPYVTGSMEEDNYRECRIGFISDVVENEQFVNPLRVGPSSGWGSMAWGSDPWGSSGPSRSTPLRVPVPTRYRRCRGLSTIFEHSEANATFDLLSLSLVARPYSDRSLK